MNQIKWIIDGWRYWDKTNGNSYHLTRITRTSTGKSLILDECPGNAASYLFHMGDNYGKVHTAPIEDISYREWRRKIKFNPPVHPYHIIKRRKLINITAKLIRKLSRTS